MFDKIENILHNCGNCFSIFVIDFKMPTMISKTGHYESYRLFRHFVIDRTFQSFIHLNDIRL